MAFRAVLCKRFAVLVCHGVVCDANSRDANHIDLSSEDYVPDLQVVRKNEIHTSNPTSEGQKKKTVTHHRDPDKIVVPAESTPARDASPRVGAQGSDNYDYDEIRDPFHRQLECRGPGSGAHCIQCRVPSTHDGEGPLVGGTGRLGRERTKIKTTWTMIKRRLCKEARGKESVKLFGWAAGQRHLMFNKSSTKYKR